MSGLPLSDRLRLCIPVPIALLALVLSALPWGTNLPLAPQVVWLTIVTLGVSYPAAWPPIVSFAFGLIADLLLGTPLGLQALVALLMTLGMRLQSRRLQHQMFRVRWMEAAGVILTANLMLWALMGWLSAHLPPILPVLRTTLVTALWFPLAYLAVETLIRLLPARK